jgi:hypothetical protein
VGVGEAEVRVEPSLVEEGVPEEVVSHDAIYGCGGYVRGVRWGVESGWMGFEVGY